MNYQLVGRPLVALGVMPVMAGVPPGAFAVLGAPPGGMRPLMGQALGAPRMPGAIQMSAAGILPGGLPPRGLAAPQLGMAGLPRIPGMLPGQVPGQLQPGQLPPGFAAQLPGQIQGMGKDLDS